ncbi:MAG: alpha-amylase family glycosyl hydrolase [Elusimicrobiota bacterium]|jgi:glycosidase
MSLRPWQDRAIYFVLIDRFYNGDPSNDDFGHGEFDRGDDNCFQGGDLKGLIAKLPFIKGMGFDALWITPPVYNQWINPASPCRGYHGYWAYDFTRIDPHFGKLEDYKELVRRAHRLGMKVIQDIVVNHTGNYFTVEAKDFDPAQPERNWKPLPGAYPSLEGRPAPDDPVFGMNDPRVVEHKAAAVYNFTPNITDFNDRKQTLTYTLGDLDDINLHSTLAVDRLKEIYRYWIKEVGVDGFRVDTVYYTPEDFYEHFLYDSARQSPGVKRYARQLGIADFFVFGEAWSYDYPGINRYLRQGRTARMDSAIDLPLNEALVQVFYRQAPTEKIRAALAQKRHNRNLWVNFLDNHDIERMFSRADGPAVRQSLVALFTLPGIPCIYYGTENGFSEPRRNMFAAKYYSGRGRYYVFLKQLLAMRKRHPLFSRGTVKVVQAGAQSGVLAYEVSYKAEKALVLFNTSQYRMHYELPPSASARQALCGPALPKNGPVILEPLAYHVLKETASQPARPATRAPGIRIALAGGKSGAVSLRILGKPARVLSNMELLLDSNYDLKQRVPAGSRDGFRVDTSRLRDGCHRVSLRARVRGGGWVVSREQPLTVRNIPRLLWQRAVPPRNRHGVHGNVLPPADPSYKGQLDLEQAALFAVGPDLELRVRMGAVSNEWNAPNGYDHVYFNVFLDIPGAGGRAFLPKLGWCPRSFRFKYGFLFYGWGVVPYGARDAKPDALGTPLPDKIEQEVDARSRSIRFRFPAELFASCPDFSGLKVFVATWDGYLGKLHEVCAQPQDWAFSVRGDMAPKEVPRIYSHILVDGKGVAT